MYGHFKEAGNEHVSGRLVQRNMLGNASVTNANARYAETQSTTVTPAAMDRPTPDPNNKHPNPSHTLIQFRTDHFHRTAFPDRGKNS